MKIRPVSFFFLAFALALLAPIAASANGLAGSWGMKANGVVGQLEFDPVGSGWQGRLNLDGFWEDVSEVEFDPQSGEIRFFRHAVGQRYQGWLIAERMSGTFNQTMRWKASRHGDSLDFDDAPDDAADPASGSEPDAATPNAPSPRTKSRYQVVNYSGMVRHPREITVDYPSQTILEHSGLAFEVETVSTNLWVLNHRLVVKTRNPVNGYWVEYDWVILDNGKMLAGCYRDENGSGPSIGHLVKPPEPKTNP